MAVGSDNPLLEIKGLNVQIGTGPRRVQAVNGVDLTLQRERTLGVVGESGCGKSVMSLSIMRLLPRQSARVRGQIHFSSAAGGRIDLNKLPPNGAMMRRIRGAEIAMVFQEPMTSLNPVYTVGAQIAEAIRLHDPPSRRQARARAVEMLDWVGIPAAAERARAYPHQLSGGMRQRVMIAMALACRPRLLICDEPTTALDVTVQAQILELLQRLQHEFHTAIILITHDLGVVAESADDVAVMYLGQVVESGPVRTVFAKRSHPYTQGLFRSLPRLESASNGRLHPIPGMVGDPRRLGPGCRFKDRCPVRMPLCDREPPLVQKRGGHQVRCWLAAPEGASVTAR